MPTDSDRAPTPRELDVAKVLQNVGRSAQAMGRIIGVCEFVGRDLGTRISEWATHRLVTGEIPPRVAEALEQHGKLADALQDCLEGMETMLDVGRWIEARIPKPD